MARVIVPYSEFREHIDEFMDAVTEEHDTLVIEREGRASVILRVDDTVSDAPLKRGKSTPEAIAAFKRAAGSWHYVDTDRLIADIYERRKASRPPNGFS
jgi:hypothetical protein